MSKHRTNKDFLAPGKYRFSERNPRGKKADWLQFACTNEETDAIMLAIGTAILQADDADMPAGMLLARICREWTEHQKRTPKQQTPSEVGPNGERL